jgi:hypothetical protein
LVGVGLDADQATVTCALPAVTVEITGFVGSGVTEDEGELGSLVIDAAFVAVTVNV